MSEGVDAREQRWNTLGPDPEERIGLRFSTLSGDNVVRADDPNAYVVYVRDDIAAARLAEVERERDDADSLIRELATILGPGKAPKSVGRVEFWIGRVGQALGEREAALERAREALEEIRDCPCRGAHAERVDVQAWNDRAWVIHRARVALVAIGPATRGGDGDGA